MPADPVVSDHYGDVLWKNGKEIQARYYWNYVLNLQDVEKELTSLTNTLKKSIPDLSKIKILVAELRSINLHLWDIENGKRLAEKNNDFGEKFIELARNVYKINDERSRIKLEINNILGSNIKEAKSHY
jgi:hypothetical protein